MCSAKGRGGARGVHEHPALPDLDRAARRGPARRARSTRSRGSRARRAASRRGRTSRRGTGRRRSAWSWRRPSGSSSWPRCRQVLANARTPPGRARPAAEGEQHGDVPDGHRALGERRRARASSVVPPEARPGAGEEVPPLPRQHRLGGVRLRGQHRRTAEGQQRALQGPGVHGSRGVSPAREVVVVMRASGAARRAEARQTPVQTSVLTRRTVGSGRGPEEGRGASRGDPRRGRRRGGTQRLRAAPRHRRRRGARRAARRSSSTTSRRRTGCSPRPSSTRSRATSRGSTRRSRAAATPTDRVRRILRLYAPQGAAPGWTLQVDAWAEALRTPELRATARRLDQRWKAALAGVIAEGVAEGTFTLRRPSRRRVAPHGAARRHVGARHGLRVAEPRNGCAGGSARGCAPSWASTADDLR